MTDLECMNRWYDNQLEREYTDGFAGDEWTVFNDEDEQERKER